MKSQERGTSLYVNIYKIRPKPKVNFSVKCFIFQNKCLSLTIVIIRFRKNSFFNLKINTMGEFNLQMQSNSNLLILN